MKAFERFLLGSGILCCACLVNAYSVGLRVFGYNYTGLNFSVSADDQQTNGNSLSYTSDPYSNQNGSTADQNSFFAEGDNSSFTANGFLSLSLSEKDTNGNLYPIANQLWSAQANLYIGPNQVGILPMAPNTSCTELSTVISTSSNDLGGMNCQGIYGMLGQWTSADKAIGASLSTGGDTVPGAYPVSSTLLAQYNYGAVFPFAFLSSYGTANAGNQNSSTFYAPWYAASITIDQLNGGAWSQFSQTSPTYTIFASTEGGGQDSDMYFSVYVLCQNVTGFQFSHNYAYQGEKGYMCSILSKGLSALALS